MGSDGNYGTNGSGGKSRAGSASPPSRVMQPRGDYHTLLSYQKAEVIYAITYRFCQRFLGKNDRTVDQMVQAARSGKQNIIEGNKAAVTSKETELKLTNVARASLEELLEDYRDFLHVRNLKVWKKDSTEAQYARKRGAQSPLTYEMFREFAETRPADVVANIAIASFIKPTICWTANWPDLKRPFSRMAACASA